MSLLAKTEPADPAPIMMKSYVSRSFWALGLAFFVLDNLANIKDLGSNETQSRVAGPNLPFYPFPICH